MDEMKFLFSKCSIFVVWQILYCTDNSHLEQTACAFDFNDFEPYLSRVIITSLYPLFSFVIILIEHSAKSKQGPN